MNNPAKLTMRTPSLADENYAALAKLFPNAVTETINEKGEAVRAIDADVLRQEINAHVVSGREERYQFTWPDKRRSILLANSPIAAALRPCREESVDFDTTENLYIEGDNLDVLKLLRETYLNRVKMIYIDPPYNTGHDFVYEDDFAEDADGFLRRDGQYDEQGNRLTSNLNSNGRFHSDWLNMLYPRLKISRDLLKDDGVIFISIDDNEAENLKKICNEIFGEDRFIAQVIWKNKFGSGAMTSGFIGVHEYLLVYSKNIITNITRTLNEEERDNYNKTKDEKFGKRGGYVTQPLAVTTFGDRPNLRYPVKYNGQEIWPNKQWVWEKSRMLQAIENNDVVFNLQKDGSYNLRSKKYLIDENGNERRGKPTTFYADVYTQNGTQDIRELFGEVVFDYSKPVELIKYFLSLEINDKKSENDIILDFFSGSATTAHALMKVNEKEGSKHKYILVQLPEQCDEKTDSGKAALKLGLKTICEIGKERIRRAGKKIKDQLKIQNSELKNQQLPLADNSQFSIPNSELDTGFRVLKLDSSNMKDVYYTPEEYAKTGYDLEGLRENIKPGRTGEDLLFQVMLCLNIPLSAKIRKEGALFYVDDTKLIACFGSVDNKLLTAIAKQKPCYAVFRDSSFISDSAMVNVEQIFKTYSPATIRKVL